MTDGPTLDVDEQLDFLALRLQDLIARGDAVLARLDAVLPRLEAAVNQQAAEQDGR